jgi:hypothetical protein
MKKEDILKYVDGYYRATRQTKNGLFIYSGVYKKPTKWNKTGEIYTYISGEDINVQYNKEDVNYLIEGLNSFKNEVDYYRGV